MSPFRPDPLNPFGKLIVERFGQNPQRPAAPGYVRLGNIGNGAKLTPELVRLQLLLHLLHLLFHLLALRLELLALGF